MLWLRVIVVIWLLDTNASSVTSYGQNPKDSRFEIVFENSKTQSRFQTLKQPGLENVFQIDAQIYSGNGPTGTKSFAALQKMGIKTIVSVDGIKPDLERAKAAGIKYIHVPIGYDGISPEAGFAFARVARELKGPIYIHCHHGRHRGPAAAAVVALCRGSLDKKQAFLFLEQAGTSKAYSGLWRDVNQFRVPSSNIKLPKLVESAQVDPMVTAMAQINRQYEQIKKMAESESQSENKLLQLSTLLREEFHEAARKHAGDYDLTFKGWLSESERQVETLRTEIKKGNRQQVVSGLKRLKYQCKRCHQKYRD